jgi:hypothetical protein
LVQEYDLDQIGQVTLDLELTHLLNINSAIDPSLYKEIDIKSYWINNNLEIWNYLTVLLGLRTKTGYTSRSIILNRI